MDIKVLGSSSKGNAYLISDGKTTILLECGLPFGELRKKSYFAIPSHIDACLCSHSHLDHSKSVRKLLHYGVDVYAPYEVFKSQGLENHHRAHRVQHNTLFTLNSLIIKSIEMFHDVPCVGYLIKSIKTQELLLFATDTYMIKYAINGLDYIMIEANYDVELVEDKTTQDRLFKSHMSIDATIDYLKKIDLSKMKKIYLMHLSSRHSNEQNFKRRVQAATGVQVVVCEE